MSRDFLLWLAAAVGMLLLAWYGVISLVALQWPERHDRPPGRLRGFFVLWSMVFGSFGSIAVWVSLAAGGPDQPGYSTTMLLTLGFIALFGAVVAAGALLRCILAVRLDSWVQRRVEQSRQPLPSWLRGDPASRWPRFMLRLGGRE